MMLERIFVYGIDAPELEQVAKVLEKRFNIAFDTENHSEMGGIYYIYAPDEDGDELWRLHRPDDDLVEDDGVSSAVYPIDLRIWDAPDMGEVKRKMAEIEEFTVELVDWVVIDGETGNVIAEHDSDELSPEDGVVNAT